LSFEKLSPRYGHQAQKDHSEGHAAYHSLRNGFYGYPVTEANCRRKRSWTVGYGRRQLSRNPPTLVFSFFFYFSFCDQPIADFTIHNDNFLVFLIKVQIKTDMGVFDETVHKCYSSRFLWLKIAYYTNACDVDILYLHIAFIGTWI